MSADQIPDFQVVECFDLMVNKCIAKERKIGKQTGKLIEFIWKIIELVVIIAFIAIQLTIHFIVISPSAQSCEDTKRIFLYINHQSVMITFLITYGVRVLVRLVFLIKTTKISEMKIFLKKEQPKRALFGFVVILLSIWGLFINSMSLQILSLQLLYMIYVLFGAAIFCSAVVNKKLVITDPRQPDQTTAIVQFNHLTSLTIHFQRHIYVEQFLVDTKTLLPKLTHLIISYDNLRLVTDDFTRADTRRNCSKVQSSIFIISTVTVHS
ncbi:unnamed protein product [Adineta ricciae]|uniref:Uncharacterized protein n=1 Tax=Adineta ricciae TaxID=249248 RepID=A0A815NIN8_ADIRI|nr:unnamed protein product [Adineta ricciae]CAF1473077.1 unnamed protein product [Adineta ricciae]